MCPLLIALVRQYTGSYRIAFMTVVIFFLVGLFILHFVDISLGKAQARSFMEMEARQNAQLSTCETSSSSLSSSSASAAAAVSAFPLSDHAFASSAGVAEAVVADSDVEMSDLSRVDEDLTDADSDIESVARRRVHAT